MLLDPRLDGPTAIRVQFGAIFVSLELSRSSWLVTSLSPGNGEKMSKHSVGAGDMAQLLGRLAELQRKVSSPPAASGIMVQSPCATTECEFDLGLTRSPASARPAIELASSGLVISDLPAQA